MATPPVANRHAKQTRFLAGLAQGKSPAEAASLTDVPLPTFYTWRHKHTRFRDAWNKAVAHGRTPAFPSVAQLATINLDKPKSHWCWLPGGFPEGEGVEPPVFRPGDWVATVLRSFGEEEGKPSTVVYWIVQGEGRPWRQHHIAYSDQPMPEGVEHPPYAHALPPELAKTLPPKPQSRAG